MPAIPFPVSARQVVHSGPERLAARPQNLCDLVFAWQKNTRPVRILGQVKISKVLKGPEGAHFRDMEDWSSDTK